MSLVRGIRRWDLVALIINNIIGAGIFGLPSKVFALAGTYSIFALLACAVVVSLIILCFAEVSSRFTKTGGPYLYAREAFGPIIGFEIGWLAWVSRLTSFATICNLFVAYLNFILPEAQTETWRASIIVCVVVALTTINLLGVRQSAVVTNIFTVGKLLPLLLFVGVGLFFLDTRQFSLATPPSAGAFSTAAMLWMFSFFGFEAATIVAGEVAHPRRDFPFAMFVAMGIVSLLYISIQAVCIGTLPELASSERPLADASDRFLGSAGTSVVLIGALLSMAGSLNVVFLTCTRLPFALAEQGQLPNIVAQTNERFHTPHIAILLSAAFTLFFTLSTTFMSAITISTITRMLTYGVTCAALIKFRRTKGEAAFETPAGIVVAIASLALIVWLVSNSTGREALDVTIVATVGLVLYFSFRRMARQAPR